jgi:hypothetical protein
MRQVHSTLNFAVPMSVRPRYHANDSSLDVLDLATCQVDITDARSLATKPSLAVNGFQLFAHTSAIGDFTDIPANTAVHQQEIAELMRSITGADEIAVTGPGVLRFSERSGKSGKLNNSRPARFVHVDVNDETAVLFANRSNPQPVKTIRRFAQFNIWRSFSGAPQDVPLAVCDARTVAAQDLIEADAVFDEPDKPVWSFTGLVVARNPAHRWHYYPDMTVEEVLVFTTNDSDPSKPHCVPHGAFDDPGCPEDVPPRASIEMRCIAYWYD